MLPLSIAGRTAANLGLANLKITQNEEPWLSTYNKMVNSGNAAIALPQRPSSVRFSTSSSYPAAPVSVLLDDTPTQNGTSLTLNRWYDDAVAAYAQARRWVVTGNSVHLTNAKNILNAWSSTLTGIQGKTNTQPSAGTSAKEQARLVTAWAVPFLCSAADILRNWPGGTWAPADSAAFDDMLIDIVLPMMDWSNIGNWSAAFAEARICIGVITEDTAIFNAACDYWLDRIPRSIYMTRDGVRPLYPRPAKMPPWPVAGGTQYASSGIDTPNEVAIAWYFNSDASAEYVDGLSCEAGRDLGHTTQGICAWVRGATTAYLNGRTDLLDDEGDRLVKAVELNAAWVREAAKFKTDYGLTESAMDSSAWVPIGRYNLTTGSPDGNGQPWLSEAGGRFKWGGNSVTAGWEYAYNELSLNLGNPMPNTEALLTGWTDGGTYGNLRGTPGVLVAGPVGHVNQFAWESLDVIEADTLLPPVADFVYSATNLDVDFDASSSTDPDGSIVSYSWNFGDSNTSSGVTTSHTYAGAGTYNVTLTVTDNDTFTDSVSYSVTVSAAPVLAPPIPTFTRTPTSNIIPAEVSVNASGSVGATGYSWDWGDGSPDSSGSTATHTYSSAGSYTITLTATNASGSTTTTRSFSALSNPSSPVADPVPVSGGRRGWRFYDPILDETYVFPVNPNADSGSNARSRSVAYIDVAGSRQNSLGNHTIDTIMYTTGIEQSTFSYDGNVYDIDQFNALNNWANKGRPIHMIDDLGRELLVYITKLTFSRVRSRQNPFKHSYNLSGIILEEL